MISHSNSAAAGTEQVVFPKLYVPLYVPIHASANMYECRVQNPDTCRPVMLMLLAAIAYAFWLMMRFLHKRPWPLHGVRP